jgi:hypothetical protein
VCSRPVEYGSFWSGSKLGYGVMVCLPQAEQIEQTLPPLATLGSGAGAAAGGIQPFPVGAPRATPHMLSIAISGAFQNAPEEPIILSTALGPHPCPGSLART